MSANAVTWFRAFYGPQDWGLRPCVYWVLDLWAASGLMCVLTRISWLECSRIVDEQDQQNIFQYLHSGMYTGGGHTKQYMQRHRATLPLSEQVNWHHVAYAPSRELILQFKRSMESLWRQQRSDMRAETRTDTRSD